MDTKESNVTNLTSYDKVVLAVNTIQFSLTHETHPTISIYLAHNGIISNDLFKRNITI